MVSNTFYVTSVEGQFVEHPDKKVIDSQTRELVDRLPVERISLAGIARAAQVSEQWLQQYVNEKYASVPRIVHVSAKKRETNDSIVRVMAAIIGRNHSPRFCLVICR